MEETVLYHQIAASIRKEILDGHYKPGDRLPSVRKLCEEWDCTPGTIQRAYNELAREGLLVSRPGRGTQVAGVVPQVKAQAQYSLRRANLVNRMEAALLEAITAGYELDEIQRAMELAMDRWRAFSALKEDRPAKTLRFSGSHDMVMNELAYHFSRQIAPEIQFHITYHGSLGGLIALAEGKADLAGCHLWDQESDTYNLPYVRRLFPGQAVVIVTLAHRRQGLIVRPGNPHKIQGLADLTRPGIRFVNRQGGSGTRVWLDAMLGKGDIDASQIIGFDDERLTHSDVARTVAEGTADVGLGLENAGHAYGLDFIFLNRERYDLVIPADIAKQAESQRLFSWLRSEEGKAFIDRHRGYESQESGNVQEI
jgi:putative molybdopterin biosynthesis protein